MKYCERVAEILTQRFASSAGGATGLAGWQAKAVQKREKELKMDHVTLVNKEVSIVAYYFKNHSRRLRCFPKRMEWDGQRVNFTETGMVHPTAKGQRMIHVFDMTDGNMDYRLEFDAQALSWTLVAITDVNYASVSAQPSFAA